MYRSLHLGPVLQDTPLRTITYNLNGLYLFTSYEFILKNDNLFQVSAMLFL